MCAWVACLYLRHILLLQDNMLPKQTVGPLKSSVWRSMLQLPRTQSWMPAALESQVNSASGIEWAVSNEKGAVVAEVNTHFLKVFSE